MIPPSAKWTSADKSEKSPCGMYVNTSLYTETAASRRPAEKENSPIAAPLTADWHELAPQKAQQTTAPYGEGEFYEYKPLSQQTGTN